MHFTKRTEINTEANTRRYKVLVNSRGSKVVNTEQLFLEKLQAMFDKRLHIHRHTYYTWILYTHTLYTHYTYKNTNTIYPHEQKLYTHHLHTLHIYTINTTYTHKHTQHTHAHTIHPNTKHTLYTYTVLYLYRH